MKKILEEIKPSEKEKKEVKTLVNTFLKKIKIKDCILKPGGSIAKNTWLRGDHDIDIYAIFNFNKYKDKDISKILEKALKKHYKIKRLKGSRDYFHIKIKNYTLEIVPIVKISKASQALNITDISPLHTKYVNKFKNKDQILLTKAFFKANNCYGAESHIKGFSGYVIELLTIHYKTFDNLIKNISKWKTKTIIGNKELVNKLNKSKKQSPLIFIDPTDPRRNASAALSKEKYNIIIKKAKEYLKNPSPSFFKQKPFKLPKTKHNLIVLKVTPLKGKTDVVGSKLLYTYNYIKKKLIANEFKVLNSGWNWDKGAIFYYIIDKKPLSKYKKHRGPPISKKSAIKRFTKKWKHNRIYKEKNKIYIKILRKQTIAKEYIQQLIKKDKNIKSKVKKIKVIK